MLLFLRDAAVVFLGVVVLCLVFAAGVVQAHGAIDPLPAPPSRIDVVTWWDSESVEYGVGELV